MPEHTFSLAGATSIDRLGFGAMRITGTGVWGEPDDPDEARRVLRRAVELGVDFIDTANSYGPEVSERLIGETLGPDYDGVIVATKGGMTRSGPDRWKPNCEPGYLREACEGSLQRLGVETIDLYQLHTVDRTVPYEESVGALKDLQDQGKIRHIGVSNVSVAQLEQARAIVEVVSVQNRYSVSDRDAEDVLDASEQAGIAFIPWYPIANGDLARPDGALGRVAEEHDATPAQLSLAWLLHRSPVMVPIPGTSSVVHLEENMAARDLELSEEQMARIEEAANG